MESGIRVYLDPPVQAGLDTSFVVKDQEVL